MRPRGIKVNFLQRLSSGCAVWLRRMRIGAADASEMRTGGKIGRLPGLEPGGDPVMREPELCR
jgi:hypothetical protein